MLRRAIVVACAVVALVLPAAPALADDVFVGDCTDPDFVVDVRLHNGDTVYVCGNYP